MVGWAMSMHLHSFHNSFHRRLFQPVNSIFVGTVRTPSLSWVDVQHNGLAQNGNKSTSDEEVKTRSQDCTVSHKSVVDYCS